MLKHAYMSLQGCILSLKDALILYIATYYLFVTVLPVKPWNTRKKCYGGMFIVSQPIRGKVKPQPNYRILVNPLSPMSAKWHL